MAVCVSLSLIFSLLTYVRHVAYLINVSVDDFSIMIINLIGEKWKWHIDSDEFIVILL